MLTSINPATGETLTTYPLHDTGEVDRRLAAAATAWRRWRTSPAGERSDVLRALAGALRGRKRGLAELITREMGKALGEVDKCAWVCDHYAEHGAAYVRPEPVETEARDSYVRFDPLGPLLAIMPWNFPLYQVFRQLAPALSAGNVVLLKHAENVTGCALAIEDLVTSAADAAGLLTVLVVERHPVGDVIDDPRVAGVALTGSVGAGRAVAARAGAALKPTVLELGGSDPFIVLADADLDDAAAVAAEARLINSGQSCVAAKRFLVERGVAEAFLDRFCAAVAAKAVGDPMDERNAIGPLARRDLRDVLERQVAASLEAGARAVLTGGPVDGPGWFYEPAVMVGADPDMPVLREETFGPVAAVDDAAAAVATANASDFGLGAAVWTRDLDRARLIAGQLEAGSVVVNGLVRSDPRMPFGGVKQSGIGRELGEAGMREFTNVKSVWVS